MLHQFDKVKMQDVGKQSVIGARDDAMDSLDYSKWKLLASS